MKKKVHNKKMDAIKLMPPLYHKYPGYDYEPQKSEVINWLIKNPNVLEYIWDKFKQSNLVEYNPQTGKWQGVDYED